MKKFLLAVVLQVVLLLDMNAQTNVFPANGSVGIGTNTPNAWFGGKVLEIKDNRPIIRLSPATEGGLATILLKGRYSNAPGTPDEFHINYVSSLTQTRVSVGSYLIGGVPIFTIMGNGKVGIGIEFPTDKLSVNGNIRAHEIKVEVANWPDYVFDSDYKLPSLPETETYIKTNHHLPNVPSAMEVKENGVNLGEMNAKLLQKIEELTMHLIEKDKEINKLKEMELKVAKLEA